MSKIVFMGDSHGNAMMIAQAYSLAVQVNADRVVSVGDWGSWPGPSGDDFVAYCSDSAVSSGIPLYVCRGNHDDPSRLEYGEAFSWTKEGHKQIAPGVFFLGRTGVWNWDGKWFAVCGGAYSIDKWARKPGISWWNEETITLGDIENLSTAREEAGIERVDVLITHDAPTSLPEWEGFIKDDPRSDSSRGMIDLAHIATRPRLQFAGHYHRYNRWNHFNCEVHTLSCDSDAAGMWGGDYRSLAVFDTDTFDTDIISLDEVNKERND